MKLKDKLVIICSAIVMTLCVLFGVAWVASGYGYGSFDLPMLLKGIEVIKGVLSLYMGMQ